MNSVLFLGTGLMSTFGGPADLGVNSDEGLALMNPTDLHLNYFKGLFLPQQPPGTTGLARRLNPDAFYIAMRWDEVLKPHELYYSTGHGRNLVVSIMLRQAVVRLTNPKNQACCFVRPVDYGPGNGRIIDGKQDPDTGRIADLSPAAAQALGLQTDEHVTCELILPQRETT